MRVYCDVIECENCNNGICVNKFDTGEEAIKLHMNCMGEFICTDMDIPEEELNHENG